MDKKKRKGGAARLRESKKKMLLVANSSCHNLVSMFKKAEFNQMEITVSVNNCYC